MIKVGVVIGSTRPGRRGEAVAKWTLEKAKQSGKAQFELIDLLDHNLSILDEPSPPAQHKYTQEHTKKWAALVDSFDAFIFVTPEYNHSPPASLKNALDFVYREWTNKACGFVGYGTAGGVRSVEILRLVVSALGMADVSSQVQLSLYTDFDKDNFKPDPRNEKSLMNLVDQVVAWGEALAPLRKGQTK